MFEQINLFPETRYFRCKKSSQIDHQCGGIASLLIILTLLTVFTVKLVEVFKKQSVFYTTNTSVALTPPISSVSTQQNGTHIAPYMLAMKSINRGCSSGHDIKAYNWTVTNFTTSNASFQSSVIPLENCTAQHFANVAEVYNKFDKLGLSTWLCLPLNKTYYLEGVSDVSNTFRRIQIQANCTQPCGVNSCGTLSVYQLNSIMNPQTSNPFEYFAERNDMDFSSRIFNEYVGYLD